MPEIDINLYDPKMKRALCASGAHSIYVAAESDDGPCKIGISNSIWRRRGSLQANTWRQIKFYFLYWASNYDLAYRVEQEVHNDLENRRINGEWFDLCPSSVEVPIIMTAERLFKNNVFYTHMEMLERMRYAVRTEERKKQKQLEKIFVAGKCLIW